MKHERDFDTSNFQNPHSIGHELLPLHHVVEGDRVDGVKGQPGVAPSASPSYPYILQISFVYFVFLHCPIAKSPERGYIVSFMSRRVHGVQVTRV
jgi:hypothetical protein